MKKIAILLIAAILALTLATSSIIACEESTVNDVDVVTTTTGDLGAGANDQGVIDPEITWNTFLGGSSGDVGSSIAVDSSGNIYVTGVSEATWGSPMRTYTSSSDAFVAKLDGSGNLIWNTFLGGSADDVGYSITVDGSGNVYVTGYSGAAWGSPVRDYTPGSDAFSYWDAYVARLDDSGNLIWNTFLGGSADDGGHSITFDGSGNVYVTGYSGATWGSPVRDYTPGSDALDAYVARLDGSGNLVWNTFMGDFGSGIAVDSSGNIYVTGMSDATWGSPVRPHSGYTDIFAAELDSSGNLIWNTFLGGDAYDLGWDLAVDGSGNVYITGYSGATWGSPVRDYTGDEDAYVAKLDSSGNLIWNTFLGGSYEDKGNGVTVDSSGNVYVAGVSFAAWGSPLWANTYLQAFVVKLDNSGNITGNTFVGGEGGDNGYGIAVDGSGNVYVAGVSGATWGSPMRVFTSGDFPKDVFVAKLSNAMLYEPVDGNGAPANADNGIDLWVWFIAGGGFILLVITGVLIRHRRRLKYVDKSIVVYLLLLAFALVVFSIPWYSGHYGYPSYEETNVNGWDLIEWQWNKTLDDSSFPYVIGICIGIVAIATRKYYPVPLFLTVIAGAFMLFALWQCLIAGYYGPRELTFQPPEALKAGAVLAYIIPVAYMVIGSIICQKWKYIKSGACNLPTGAE